MVKRNSSKRTRKSKTKKGGGWAFTGASVAPGLVNNDGQVNVPIGDCRAVQPPSYIPTSQYGKYTGLPGLSGGNRRQHKGGRYGFDMSAINEVSPNGAAPWAGTYAPVHRIPCEASTPNPLNPGPHTPSTDPPISTLTQKGGVGDGPDSAYYYAPTAGYDNKPSSWVDSVGAPVQLQIPFAARSMNPACLTTGHPEPLTGSLALQQQGGSRKNRNRKTTRKSRKNNRKSSRKSTRRRK